MLVKGSLASHLDCSHRISRNAPMTVFFMLPGYFLSRNMSHVNLINSITADALIPCVARSSTAKMFKIFTACMGLNTTKRPFGHIYHFPTPPNLDFDIPSSRPGRPPGVISRDINSCRNHVLTWIRFPRYWPFLSGIYGLPLVSSHKRSVTGVLMFPLISTPTDCWTNSRIAVDLKRHDAHATSL